MHLAVQHDPHAVGSMQGADIPGTAAGAGEGTGTVGRTGVTVGSGTRGAVIGSGRTARTGAGTGSRIGAGAGSMAGAGA